MIVVGTVSARETQPDTTPAPIIVRIYYDEISDLNQLSTFDLFELNNLQERYVLAAVSGAEQQMLRDNGWVVVAEDAHRAADGVHRGALERDLYFNGYRTVDELHVELARLSGQYPALSEVVVYGQSYCRTRSGCETPGGDRTEGYELLAMRVTNEFLPGASDISGSRPERGDKPLFFVLANIHARELTTPEIAMRWLALLLDDYGKDPDITWLVDWHEMWIIPTANPDGHWLTELGDDPTYGSYPLMHRKNFDQDADGDGSADCAIWPSQNYSHFGVDLNRNHSYAWLAPAATTSACEPTYAGPSAASEPEVVALQELVRALFADRRSPDPDDPAAADTSGILFTLHNYGELVLRPWGFSDQPAPNEDGLKAIGDKLAASNDYLSCRPPECLYSAHGTTDDWAYGELGLPAFTFEIGTYQQGFSPPYAVIDQEQWPRNREAFLDAARLARAPYRLIQGPDVSQLSVSAADYGENQLVAVKLDERGHGGQEISGAEYSVDIPFWDSAADPRPMTPSNNNSADSTASFLALLDVAELAPGRHTVFVHGQDINGNYGVTRSAFFEVPETQQPQYTYFFLPVTAGQ